MTEVQLPQVPEMLSAEALFRYCVIVFVLSRVTLGHSRAEAIADAIVEPHLTATGTLRTISKRSLYRWLGAFERGGIAALEPARHERSATALSPKFLQLLRTQKAEDPLASIPEIIRRARELGTLSPEEPVSRVTAYRAAKLDPIDALRHE